jgi:hypothetical protein
MSWCWRVYFFEPGADRAYCSKRYFSRRRMKKAVALYLRLGGDDIMRVVPPRCILACG